MSAGGLPEVRAFGALPDGRQVKEFLLRNVHGTQVRIINWGGIILSLRTADRDGNLAEIVLGHDDLQSYLPNAAYLGSLIGRYANRIRGGCFDLDDRRYLLSTNEHGNTLHGGERGFDQVLWNAARFAESGVRGLTLWHRSPHGDQGFPGTLEVMAVYRLDDDNQLRLDLRAATDRATVVSLTQHSYFNLAGGGEVLDHLLMVPAERFTPVECDMIPNGEMQEVARTPFDFRTAIRIGERISHRDEQLVRAGGYDHNFVVQRTGARRLVARVHEPRSGRVLEVASDAPGLQFYSGNRLDGSIRGHGGVAYQRHHGFALEPQQFPNAPNEPGFPSAVLRERDVYRCSIVYRFGIDV